MLRFDCMIEDVWQVRTLCGDAAAYGKPMPSTGVYWSTSVNS